MKNENKKIMKVKSRGDLKRFIYKLKKKKFRKKAWSSSIVVELIVL